MGVQSFFLSIKKWGSRLMPEPLCIPVRRVIGLAYLAQTIGMNTSNTVREEISFYISHQERLEARLETPFIIGLLESVYLTESIEGNIIELGTFKGGSTLMVARLLKRIGSKKAIFACDTFEGHPYDDRYSNLMKRKGEFSDTNVNYVLSKFQRFSVEDKITIVKGLFEETLVSKLTDKRFSLAFVDCDLYDSTKYVLEFLHPRMNCGGRIVLHDYGHPDWGLTKAVDEWCEKNGLRVNLNPVPYIEKI